jgi:ABC-type ATPase involved in cell division
VAKLDAATRRLLGEVSEYRQMAQGMSHSPVSEEVMEALEAVEDGIRHSQAPEPLSPGQQDAMATIGATLDNVVIEEDGESPGEREVAGLSSVNQ